MLWTHIDKLTPWEQNPRINAGAIPKVAASIKRFGFVAPVVVWTSKGRIVAGHTRVEALRSILAEDPDFKPGDAPAPGLVPVREHEFKDEAEAAAYGVADNRLSYEAEWDYAQLGDLLRGLDAVDPSLLLSTGFSPAEFEAFTKQIEWSPPPLTDVNADPFGGARAALPVQQGLAQQPPQQAVAEVVRATPSYVSLQLTQGELEVICAFLRAHDSRFVDEGSADPMSVASALVRVCRERLGGSDE